MLVRNKQQILVKLAMKKKAQNEGRSEIFDRLLCSVNKNTQ